MKLSVFIIIKVVSIVKSFLDVKKKRLKVKFNPILALKWGGDEEDDPTKPPL